MADWTVRSQSRSFKIAQRPSSEPSQDEVAVPTPPRENVVAGPVWPSSCDLLPDVSNLIEGVVHDPDNVCKLLRAYPCDTSRKPVRVLLVIVHTLRGCDVKLEQHFPVDVPEHLLCQGDAVVFDRRSRQLRFKLTLKLADVGAARIEPRTKADVG